MIVLENDELIAYINLCNEQLRPDTKLLYEASFFKIFVKFEKYLSDMFELYCVGRQSSLGFVPNRKLAFQDEERLISEKSQNRRAMITRTPIFYLSKN